MNNNNNTSNVTNGVNDDNYLSDEEKSSFTGDDIENGMEIDGEAPKMLEAPTETALGLRDRFGFLLEDDGNGFHRSLSISPSEQRRRREKETERLKKWRKMQKNWKKYFRPPESDPNKKVVSKARERARKGIPDACRAWAWYQFCNASKAKRLFPNPSTLDIGRVPSNVIDEINRDIDRTFPRHELFIEDDGYGQQALRRLLQRYAVLDPAVGYCQGMGFIAAMLLTYYVEEDAFHVFYAILNRKACPLRVLFLPRLTEVQRVLVVFGSLGKKLLGRLWQHLEAENVHPTMYFTEWVMTMFTRGFSFELVTRVWDVLLCEQSMKIMYRVSLGLLKSFEVEFMSMKFEQILAFLRELPKHVDADRLMEVAFSIPLKTSQIVKYQAKYDAQAETEERRKLKEEEDRREKQRISVNNGNSEIEVSEKHHSSSTTATNNSFDHSNYGQRSEQAYTNNQNEPISGVL